MKKVGTDQHLTHISTMAKLGDWIDPKPQGIYVKPADAWIDPSVPSPCALVTHGHADHGELVGSRRPAARREPVGEGLGEIDAH